MNIQWWVVMKSKCSVWESVFRRNVRLLCGTARLCWWREMRDFMCTDRAEILPHTFNGLSDSRWRCHCACTDGGHFVLAKQHRFVCLGEHWWVRGQRNDPSVNTEQNSLSCFKGVQNQNGKRGWKVSNVFFSCYQNILRTIGQFNETSRKGWLDEHTVYMY